MIKLFKISSMSFLYANRNFCTALKNIKPKNLNCWGEVINSLNQL